MGQQNICDTALCCSVVAINVGAKDTLDVIIIF